MKKVLIINGSAHKSGNTARALQEIERTLQAEGLATETVQIGTKPVRGCIGCNKCHEKALGKCIFDDDITNQISAKAAEVDAFVIGAPVYYGQPAAQAMAVVQRMLYSNTSNIIGKPVANVAIARRGGATTAYQTMNMPWMMLNCPIVTSQYWNIAYGLTPGEVAADAEGMQTMRTLGRNMARLVRSLENEPMPELEPWNPTHFVREDLADKMN